MYKAPPPEISSEQFYETDPARGFARGFSIQTVSPLPIGWAEHVLADGHWGRALREYMRDYNHWATIGVLNELLPQPDNRVTPGRRDRPVRAAGRRMDYTLSDNDKANMAWSTNVIIEHPARRPARRTCSRSSGTPTSSAARGWAPRPTDSVVDADQRVLGVPNLFVADGSGLPDPGRRQPGADDHGAGLAARRADGERRRDGRRPGGPDRADERDPEPDAVEYRERALTGVANGPSVSRLSWADE